MKCPLIVWSRFVNSAANGRLRWMSFLQWWPRCCSQISSPSIAPSAHVARHLSHPKDWHWYVPWGNSICEQILSATTASSQQILSKWMVGKDPVRCWMIWHLACHRGSWKCGCHWHLKRQIVTGRRLVGRWCIDSSYRPCEFMDLCTWEAGWISNTPWCTPPKKHKSFSSPKKDACEESVQHWFRKTWQGRSRPRHSSFKWSSNFKTSWCFVVGFST